jgi:hypothetical protein
MLSTLPKNNLTAPSKVFPPLLGTSRLERPLLLMLELRVSSYFLFLELLKLTTCLVEDGLKGAVAAIQDLDATYVLTFKTADLLLTYLSQS